ncbi:hypothetical protein WDJ51_02025 [Rathayibacter sp. YIM 133350]|uniref:hypothetical protein n=1 Tax=Rathayibacter sp. YIM 133350 TaxID=3131992 RepID=UPI00307DE8EE
MTDAHEDALPPTGPTPPPAPPAAPLIAPPLPPQPAWGQQQAQQPQWGPPQPPQPQWGQQQPQWGAYGAALPGSAPGWTPPPKPGLIPLRPLSFATILGAPYQLLRRNPKATFGSALLIQLIVAVASTVIVLPLAFVAATRLQNARAAEVGTIMAGTIGWVILGMLVLVVLSVLSTAMLQGVIVLEVARASLGEKLSLGALWKQVLRRLLPLSAWVLLLGAAFLLAAAIIVAIAVALFSAGQGFLAAGVVFSILGVLGLIVLFAWLYTKTVFVPCAIVLERRGIGASVARSWSLTRGAFWKIFGTNLLVLVMVNVAANIVTAPLSLIVGFASAALDPNGTGQGIFISIGATFLSLIISIIVGSIASVVQSATIALLYIDQRMRREGLDLELQRFVEQRAAQVPGADPYLTPVA